MREPIRNEDMARFLGLLAVAAIAAAFWLLADDERLPSPQRVAPAPEPTSPLSQGIERSRAVITVRRGGREWELRGGLDLSEGYRYRGRITTTADRHLAKGTPIWLAGGHGTWAARPGVHDTMTKQAFGRERPVWFDDHPPTLPLARGSFDEDDGAETYAHLALRALKHGTHDRRYGGTDPDVTVGEAGRVERLHLEHAATTVDVRLFASDHPVGPLRTRRFALE